MRSVLVLIPWIVGVCRGVTLPCSLAALFYLGCEEFHERGTALFASLRSDDGSVWSLDCDRLDETLAVVWKISISLDTLWGMCIYCIRYLGGGMKFLNLSFGAHRLLTCGAYGCWLVMAMVAAPVMAQSEAIPTVAAQARAVGSVYELDGVIQAVKQSTLSAQASGRIASLLVKAGDRVRAGQLLATIDDREALVSVQKSQAQINQAEAELRNAQAHLDRTRDLQGKGFVSKAALDTADAQYQSSLAMREQAAAAAKQSGISQGFTRINAPYDGWVLQTHVQAGDLAVPGVPLVTIYAPQPLRAVVQVPGARNQAVRSAPQMAVQIRDANGQLQWITPTSRSVVPSADPVSQTTEWRLDLPAKESANLVPGQQVRVRFDQAQAGAASKLVLPQVAVVRRGELTAVYVVVGNGFSLRAVRLGAAQGTDGVEVLAGVLAGEVVALDPVRAGLAHATPMNAKK